MTSRRASTKTTKAEWPEAEARGSWPEGPEAHSDVTNSAVSAFRMAPIGLLFVLELEYLVNVYFLIKPGGLSHVEASHPAGDGIGDCSKFLMTLIAVLLCCSVGGKAEIWYSSAVLALQKIKLKTA